MSYEVMLRCQDCFGEDPLGCFDGGEEPFNDGWRFETIADAEEAGREATKECVLWEYEVVKIDEG